MIWLAVQALRQGDVFIRQDKQAARVVSIRRSELVRKTETFEWMVRTATGYVFAENPKKTSFSIDERDRFVLKIETFERDQQFRRYDGEMNLHKDQLVLVVDRGPE